MPQYQINDTQVMYYVERIWYNPLILEVVYRTRHKHLAERKLQQLMEAI